MPSFWKKQLRFIFINQLEMKIYAVLFFAFIIFVQSQILIIPARPGSLPQFGSVILEDLNFQVVPSNPDSQNTGFSTEQQTLTSTLVHLPAQGIFFRSFSDINFYETFGRGSHSPSIIQLSSISRNSDGSKNNLVFPLWGSSHIRLTRFTRYAYTDGIYEPDFKKLNARQISNDIGKIKIPFQKSQNNVTVAFVFFGQFLDHDISLTQAGSQYMPIKIPECDQFMDRQCHGIYQIPFNRSHFVQQSQYSPRQQVNFITAWVDGSQIYGSDEQTTNRLRKFEKGQLIMDSSQFLPRVKNDRFNLFDAGDIRVNENVILTSYHTIFARQHNRLCQVLLRISPFMSDEEVFQAARNYVVGLLQKITYQDFLPIMIGPEMHRKFIGPYKGYNPYVNPQIANQFSTVAFRIGHVLMINKFPLINRYEQVQEEKMLHELFFNPSFLNENSLGNVIRGVTKTLKKQKSPQIIDQLRNLLIPGAEDRVTNLDLFALNIQRGLDHGLPNYNEIRVAYGLRPLSSFEQMTDIPERVEKLKRVYGSPDNCDPWVGIISEKSLQGAVLGQLGATIVGEQFERLRSADRFWYERDYPLSVQSEIKTTHFSQIIMRNTGILGLQQNIFYLDR